MSRSTLDQVLAFVGVATVVVPVTLLSETWTPIVFVLIGIGMIGAGVWGLSQHLFPDRRIYMELRSEVDGFIDLVRQLNARKLAAESDEVERIRERMKSAVDRMVEVAGVKVDSP